MKILGLDLGTNSIGWAVVDKDNDNILDAGVRIFPEGIEPTTIGQGDKEKSKNATRRDNRQMRRQFYRKRLRKIKLLEVLIEQGMCPLTIKELRKWKNWDNIRKNDGRKFPETKEFTEWLSQNPYELRSKAISEKVSLHELGRIFYHMIQRRGFLSNRKSKEESAIFTKGKPDENILPINLTREKIGNSTLGTYLHSISYTKGHPYYTIKDDDGVETRVRGRYTIRDMYVNEFERIWAKQERFHDLSGIYVESKKIREFKGTLSGSRIAKKIKHLKTIFGEENVKIEDLIYGRIKVSTISPMPLKEYLGGKIEILITEDGNPKLQFKSNDSVLFWQRPLRSQKGLLANCRFENNLPVIRKNGDMLLKDSGEPQTRSKKPCPLSHPDFELFRALQFINNIVYGKNNRLTKEQRSIVLDLINRNDKNFYFKKVPEVLKLTYEKFNYSNEQKIAGNATIKALKPLFEKDVWEQHYEDIWHCFYFYEDNDKLFQKVKTDYRYNGDIEKIKSIKLKDGYGSISLKAIRNILPFLEMGFTYDRAVILGGVKNTFGKRWEYFKNSHDEIIREIIGILKEDNKEGEAITKIKDYLSSPVFGFGFVKDDPRFQYLYHHSEALEVDSRIEEKVPEVDNLRNPIAQQALHETRRLVNNLLDKYRASFSADFKFDRIHVEMGRNLRNNKDGRREMGIRISENEKKNDEARERLAEFGLKPSRDNIQKYLMFKEIEERAGKAHCPYTGKIISVSDLLGRDNTVQIEHIVPYSISLDDSFGNKTICEANFNREKGEKTPWQYYMENPDPKLWGANSWEEVQDRAFRLLPYRKAKKFIAKREFEKSDFIQRQLNDSRYIARKAVELLSRVCNDVRVMPGQLTAELRHLWGLNNILQPALDISEHSFSVNDSQAVPYYALISENRKLLSLHIKYNERPKTKSDEFLAQGYVKKEKFHSKFFNLTFDVSEMADGKYWAKLKVTDPIEILPVYADRPDTDESQIVMRGIVEKGYFKNDNLGSIQTNVEEGTYWAKLKVLNQKFEMPARHEQPKTKRNQILLFGDVKDGIFKSYIYSCTTNLPDDKYWIIIDIDPACVEFIRAVNPRPEITNNQILVKGTVDEEGNFGADTDAGYVVKTNVKKGKYYILLELTGNYPEFYKIENEPPKPEKDQQLVEGSIWVDKYTGEIKFDPKKNRDDHRHHAIDAITIALTEQGYLQRLSTYNAQRKEKLRQKLDSTEHFPEPWGGFVSDVQKVVSGIMVSHKKDNKTITKTRKGWGVRGQLHKDNVFGKRKAPCQAEAYHRRVKITELKNHKHVGKVVDDTIRNLICRHLQENCNVDVYEPKGYDIPNDAFYLDGNWRLFLPNKNGHQVPIKKIRIRESMGNAVQLKSGINQYVNPRNNHHVLIYRDHDGNLQEEVVQFWTVVERQLQGEDIYQLPNNGMAIVSILQINDMFLLGLTDEEVEDNRNNPAFLGGYLYRVQKLSSLFYTFRLHTASTLLKKREELYIKSFGAWEKLNPIKVDMNMLGELQI
jgi:CRISPR-associated endonuclease Csn1